MALYYDIYYRDCEKQGHIQIEPHEQMRATEAMRDVDVRKLSEIQVFCLL
jgi:hypothetical protein